VPPSRPASPTARCSAANVDLAVVVEGLHPEPDLGRIERFLALAWESGATPLVVLTKADLVPDAEQVRDDVAAAAPGTRHDARRSGRSPAVGAGLQVMSAMMEADRPAQVRRGPTRSRGAVSVAVRTCRPLSAVKSRHLLPAGCPRTILGPYPRNWESGPDLHFRGGRYRT